MTLFDKYGGLPFVTSVVRMFCSEVFAKASLSFYFQHIDRERFVQHQIAFTAQLLEKPVAYIDINKLERIHAGKRISEAAFFDMIEILKNVLIKHQFEQDDIEKIESMMFNLKPKIVEFPSYRRIHR
jgi:Bacterial-like globin